MAISKNKKPRPLFPSDLELLLIGLLALLFVLPFVIARAWLWWVHDTIFSHDDAIYH